MEVRGQKGHKKTQLFERSRSAANWATRILFSTHATHARTPTDTRLTTTPGGFGRRRDRGAGGRRSGAPLDLRGLRTASDGGAIWVQSASTAPPLG